MPDELSDKNFDYAAIDSVDPLVHPGRAGGRVEITTQFQMALTAVPDRIRQPELRLLPARECDAISGSVRKSGRIRDSLISGFPGLPEFLLRLTDWVEDIPGTACTGWNKRPEPAIHVPTATHQPYNRALLTRQMCNKIIAN
jgi:hypothetical protein